MRIKIEDLNYKSILDLKQTEEAIKFVKDNFEEEFAKKLNLLRVSAPMFVSKNSGLNDGLNGYERAVEFDIPSVNKQAEIVHSLAKWKRVALAKYSIETGKGIYTDMNAIRRDEEVDQFHSVYVDQWDWEISISQNDRNLDYLFAKVRDIYSVLIKIEEEVCLKYPSIPKELPSEIFFISSSELEKMYPSLSPKQREDEITRIHKAVFVYQIGWKLDSGLAHDGRAADYDDWNLNGDLIVWYSLYNQSLELSSMGIRVNKDSLIKQLQDKNEQSKLNNYYCQMILNDQIPLSIGGGIGQSRLCMFFLKKAHIGEVQVSLWDDTYIKKMQANNIFLL